MQPEEISNADVHRPSRTFYVTENPSGYYLKWFYRADTETIPFTFGYTVANAITLHEDVSELYWQFVGDDWEIASNNVSIRISLPQQMSGTEVKAWAHGPLDGTVAIPDVSSVTLTAPRIIPGMFFEGRIVMPKDWFSTGAAGQGSLAEIESQEQQFIAETEAKKRRQNFLGLLASVAAGALAAASLYFLTKQIRHYFLHAKDTKLPRVNMSGTLWEPPSNIDPAQVQQLLTATKTCSQCLYRYLARNSSPHFKLLRSDQKGLLLKITATTWCHKLMPKLRCHRFRNR